MAWYETQDKQSNTPPEVEGAKAEAEPARAVRTASFIMVSVLKLEIERGDAEIGLRCEYRELLKK